MATVTPTTDVGAAQSTLTGFIKAMYPHPNFPGAAYERCSQAILESCANDVRLAATMRQGLTDLEEVGFNDLGEAKQLEHLQAMQASTFFQGVRGAVILNLYNDPEIHELLGWEGESYSKGGYLERGFNDLDWLPEAEIDREIW